MLFRCLNVVKSFDVLQTKLEIEKWFVGKRSLPRSGAYGLEMFCLFADWKDAEL